MKIKNRKFFSNWKWNTVNDIIGEFISDLSSGKILSYEKTAQTYYDSITEQYMMDIIDLNEMEIQLLRDYLSYKSKYTNNQDWKKFHRLIGITDSKFEFISSECDVLIRSIKENITSSVKPTDIIPSIYLLKQNCTLPRDINKLFESYITVSQFVLENRNAPDLKDFLNNISAHLMDTYVIDEMLIVLSSDMMKDGGISMCIENANIDNSIIKHLRSELVNWEHKNNIDPNHDNNTGDETPILLCKSE